jgi:hypothetical protein
MRHSSTSQLGRRIERLLQLRLEGSFAPADAVELSELYALERSWSPDGVEHSEPVDLRIVHDNDRVPRFRRLLTS